MKEKNKLFSIDEMELPVTCPLCDSDNVIVESVDNYFLVVFCKECGYIAGNKEF